MEGGREGNENMENVRNEDLHERIFEAPRIRLGRTDNYTIMPSVMMTIKILLFKHYLLDSVGRVAKSV